MRNMGDLQKLAQKMQADMAKAQEDLAAITVEGTAGGGAVVVVMTGTQECKEVRIRKDAVDPEDVETLEDLVRAATTDALAAAVRSVKTDLRYCTVCFNIAESDPCAICASDERDKRVVCVVEEPLDVLAIERTGQFRGMYHVLHGAISPVNGVRPDDLKIQQLVERVRKGSVEELILATNPNLEGDATAMYIGQLISGNGVRVTRLARGLPMGGDLEWADEVTVSRALEGRRGL